MDFAILKQFPFLDNAIKLSERYLWFIYIYIQYWLLEIFLGDYSLFLDTQSQTNTENIFKMSQTVVVQLRLTLNPRQHYWSLAKSEVEGQT